MGNWTEEIMDPRTGPVGTGPRGPREPDHGPREEGGGLGPKPSRVRPKWPHHLPLLAAVG